MDLQPFALERYFAGHEFSTRYLLCSSDPESLSIGELLAFDPDARERFFGLRLGYTESRGNLELRRAIAAAYAHADAESVLVHSGAQEPIFTFTNAVVRPGDDVIVQFPAYQSHYSIAEALGARIVRWHADLSHEGAPDIDELERLAGPNTRAIVITTPNNPTGYPLSRAELDAVVAIARRCGAWLLCDEAYRGLERDAERLPPACDLYERAVSIDGLAKAHGLPGLRIGWASSADRALLERMATIKDYLTICSSAPAEFLATVALRHGDALLDRARRITTENLEVLDAFFSRHPGIFAWHRPRAGTTAFPRYLPGGSAAFCARLAKEAGVLLLPSAAFDAGDEHVRFGYGRVNLPEAVAALEAFLAHS